MTLAWQRESLHGPGCSQAGRTTWDSQSSTRQRQGGATDRYKTFTDEILSMWAVTCWEMIPVHCLEVASMCVCVFWPLAKLTCKITLYQCVDSEMMVDGRAEVSGTGCTNLCVPALGHQLGKGFTTLLAGPQKAHLPHWGLGHLTKSFNLNYCS